LDESVEIEQGPTSLMVEKEQERVGEHFSTEAMLVMPEVVSPDQVHMEAFAKCTPHR
jgi:hypothetical protein